MYILVCNTVKQKIRKTENLILRNFLKLLLLPIKKLRILPKQNIQTLVHYLFHGHETESNTHDLSTKSELMFSAVDDFGF